MPRVDAVKAQIGIYTTGSTSKQPSGQYIIDVAGVRDPQSSGGFRKKYSNGLPEEVQAYVAEDPRVMAILEQAELLAYLHFKASWNQSIDWLSFVVRDHHGQWLAPAIGELLTKRLSDAGYYVFCSHSAIPSVEER